MTKIRVLLCVFLPFFLLVGNTYSQVTIGSSEKPVDGALLQLSNLTGYSIGEPNATKGLMLPRVGLVANNILTIANQIEAKSHIGTVLYNTTRVETSEEDRLCPGPHVWNGKIWEPIAPYPEIIKGVSLAGVEPDYIDARDGESYHTARFHSTKTYYNCISTPPVIIDAGVWMTQNLRFTQGLTQGISLDYFNPRYYDSGDNVTTAERKRENGKLYNWAAATNQKGNAIDGNGNVDNPPTFESNDEGYGKPGSLTEAKRQGVCPEGWHLPTHTEWITLQNALMLQPELYSTQSSVTEANIGNVFKSARHGSASGQGTSKAANNGGFDGLLCGFANSTVNTNKDYNISGHWWSNSSYPVANAWRESINLDNSIFEGNGRSSRNNMFSVRCKKD